MDKIQKQIIKYLNLLQQVPIARLREFLNTISRGKILPIEDPNNILLLVSHEKLLRRAENLSKILAEKNFSGAFAIIGLKGTGKSQFTKLLAYLIHQKYGIQCIFIKASELIYSYDERIKEIADLPRVCIFIDNIDGFLKDRAQRELIISLLSKLCESKPNACLILVLRRSSWYVLYEEFRAKKERLGELSLLYDISLSKEELIKFARELIYRITAADLIIHGYTRLSPEISEFLRILVPLCEDTCLDLIRSGLLKDLISISITLSSIYSFSTKQIFEKKIPTPRALRNILRKNLLEAIICELSKINMVKMGHKRVVIKRVSQEDNEMLIMFSPEEELRISLHIFFPKDLDNIERLLCCDSLSILVVLYNTLLHQSPVRTLTHVLIKSLQSNMMPFYPLYISYNVTKYLPILRNDAKYEFLRRWQGLAKKVIDAIKFLLAIHFLAIEKNIEKKVSWFSFLIPLILSSFHQNYNIEKQVLTKILSIFIKRYLFEERKVSDEIILNLLDSIIRTLEREGIVKIYPSFPDIIIVKEKLEKAVVTGDLQEKVSKELRFRLSFIA
ncbi:MAG: AAA family ATPase [Candidatus Njordarchaeales archaeon]